MKHPRPLPTPLHALAALLAILAFTLPARAIVLVYETGPNIGQPYDGPILLQIETFGTATLYQPQPIGSTAGVTNNPLASVLCLDPLTATQAVNAYPTGPYGDFLEDSWGIVRVTSITESTTGETVWSPAVKGTEITGIYYGGQDFFLRQDSAADTRVAGVFTKLDLYEQPVGISPFNPALGPFARTGPASYPGAAGPGEGTLLLTLAGARGLIRQIGDLGGPATEAEDVRSQPPGTSSSEQVYQTIEGLAATLFDTNGISSGFDPNAFADVIVKTTGTPATGQLWPVAGGGTSDAKPCTTTGITMTNSGIVGSSTRSLKVTLSTDNDNNIGGDWRISISDMTPPLPLGPFSSGQTRTGLITTFAKIIFEPPNGFIPPPVNPSPTTLGPGADTSVVAVCGRIKTHPTSLPNATVGSDVQFSIEVFNPTPSNRFTYRWKRGATPLDNVADGSVSIIFDPLTSTSTLRLKNITTAFAGVYTVAVSRDGTTATSRSATLTVNLATQTITFAPLPNRVICDGPFTVSASATSGLPVTFQVVSNPANATLSGTTVTPTGLGTVTLRATQAGNANYLAAPLVEQSFQVIGETLAARFPGANPFADPGNDGVNVLLAFALGLDPIANDSRPMIPGSNVGGLPAAGLREVSGQRRLTLEFLRRRAACSPGITYSVEFTSNLLAPILWTVGGTAIVSPIPNDAHFERVIVTDFLPASPTRFGRVRITQP